MKNAFCLSLFILIAVQLTIASPGWLDPTFSGDGSLVMKLGSGDSEVAASALQGDGKLVVAGYVQIGSTQHFALVRYNADGTRDSGFGDGGTIVIPFANFTFCGARGVAIQPDGKIVAAGFAATATSNFVFAVARVNSDGSMDNTFDGDGRTTTTFGSSISIGNSIAFKRTAKSLWLAGLISDPICSPLLDLTPMDL